MLQRLVRSGSNVVLQTKWTEADMPETAVGLFENPIAVERGCSRSPGQRFALRRHTLGIGASHADRPATGVMSIPTDRFLEVGLTRDLTAFGVAEADAEAYVQGVRHGGVMVFATGSGRASQTRRLRS